MSILETPFISVIIPTYNRCNFLKEAIESVLNQKYKNLELIVIDDGSSDNTKEIIKDYKNKLKYIYQPNKGVSSARNVGIKESSGEFIAFLDSDDLWLPKKLSTQVTFFQENKDAIICYTDEIWIRNGVRVNQCKKHTKYSGFIFDKSLPLCIISPSSVMMKKEIFEKVGYFDEALPACEDYDLWLRITLHFPVYFIPTPLIIKRGGHIDQLSTKYWGLDRFRIIALEKILKDENLLGINRIKTIETLIKKCNILSNGSYKRGKVEEGLFYKNKSLFWQEQLKKLM